jgi:hypothetical protein
LAPSLPPLTFLPFRREFKWVVKNKARFILDFIEETAGFIELLVDFIGNFVELEGFVGEFERTACGVRLFKGRFIRFKGRFIRFKGRFIRFKGRFIRFKGRFIEFKGRFIEFKGRFIELGDFKSDFARIIMSFVKN